MYTLPVRACVFAIVLSLFIVSGGFASGTGEQEAPPALASVSIQVFVLAEGEGDGHRMFTERVSLPEAVSLTRWTRFSVRGSEVSIESKDSLSIRSRNKASETRASGVLVQEFDLAVFLSRQAERAGDPVDVSFSVKDCLNSEGKVLFQPARMAVVRAVSQGGRSSGEARLVKISYPGLGRFAARVELR